MQIISGHKVKFLEWDLMGGKNWGSEIIIKSRLHVPNGSAAKQYSTTVASYFTTSLFHT
jgi:hypothetical protein